jgi:hypothetical protein
LVLILLFVYSSLFVVVVNCLGRSKGKREDA